MPGGRSTKVHYRAAGVAVTVVIMNIFGLPLHPLIVHATVVFVPLAALGGIVIALWRWARDRFGVLVLAAALVGAVTAFVAKESGEDLYRSFSQHTPELQAHAQIAGSLPWWALGLLVGQVVLMTAWWLGRRDPVAPRVRLLHWTGVVLTVVLALISLVWCVRAGHAGAVAVWGGR